MYTVTFNDYNKQLLLFTSCIQLRCLLTKFILFSNQPAAIMR